MFTKKVFHSDAKQMRKSRLNIHRKLTHIIVKFSTIWKQCVSITETMLCLYAVMKPAVLGSHYTTSLPDIT